MREPDSVTDTDPARSARSSQPASGGTKPQRHTVQCALSEYPRLRPAGDQAILAEFGPSFSKPVTRAVMAFDAMLQSADLGIIETAPTIRSVLIRFDPAAISPKRLEAWCERQFEARNWYEEGVDITGACWRIPVLYGGTGGPDLSETAAIAGLTETGLIDFHASAKLTVLCLGFAPGLAYLAELPAAFSIPRREAYGRPVPAGSVLVANRQTALPATPIPTGWRSIGITPLPTFLPRKSHPFLLSPGDTVQFAPISEAEAERFDPGPVWERRSHARP